MNTAGHRGVGEEAGVPLLEEALTGAGAPKPGLKEAFLIGNWLTDLSQVIDPVAYASGRAAILKVIDDFLTKLNSHILVCKGTRLDYVRALTGDKAERLLKELRRTTHAAVDYVVGTGPGDRGAFGDILRDAVLVKGWFAFAHAEEEGKAQRLPTKTYTTLFEAGFTQYFPHEHLDRPATRLNPLQYASDPDGGPRTQPDRVRWPDLYRYLRDDIEILAGALTELELDWARPVARRQIPTDGSDLAYPVGLARLGHLLHAVEDFFAHSNFIELYASSQGDTYLPKIFEPADATIYAKRLKRWSPGADSLDWRTLPQEDFVVTGIFETADTIVSLAHVAEEVLGIGWRDPDRRLGDVFREVETFELTKIEEQYYEWLQSVLQLFDNPKTAFEDRDNRVAAALKEKYGERVETLKKPEVQAAVLKEVMAGTRFLQAVPPEIAAKINNFVLRVSKEIAFGSLSMSAYRAINTLIKLFTVPLELVRELARDFTIDFAVESALYMAKDLLLYRWLLGGSNQRIGSHSLLAKDTGSEWLYRYQRACATAAHHVVVRTLLRWFDTPPPADGAVDWLHLLEGMLANPLGRDAGRFEVEVLIPQRVPFGKAGRVTEAIGEAARAAGLTGREGAPAWLRVAEASFAIAPEERPVARKIAEAIAAGGGHVPRGPRRPPALELILPDQPVSVASVAGRGEQPAGSWPAAVIERERSREGKGWEVVRGFMDFAKDQTTAGVLPVAPRFVDDAAARKRINTSAKMRYDAEQLYNALAGI